MKVDFDPAGGAGDVLSVVLSSPPLDETHSDSAHFSEFVDCLKTVIHWIWQQLGELLIVEDFQTKKNLFWGLS